MEPKRRLVTTDPTPLPLADKVIDEPRGDVVQDGGEDDGPDEEDTGPLRRCIVTRERLPKELLIRFVVAPDRTVVPDLAARLPGRGFWLSARRDVIDTACSRGAFARAARGQVVVLPDLSAVLQASLARRFVEHLGFARRAGQAVSGFQKAREWLQGGRAGLVIQASDGSPEERSRFLAGWTDRLPAVDPLTASELGSVFGREHAVHVVVSPGRLADALRNEAGRLAGVRNRNGAASGISPANATQGKGASARLAREKAESSGLAGRSDETASGALPEADGVKAGR